MATAKMLFYPFKGSDSVSEVYSYKQKTKVRVPLYSSKVSAGFPSPADDHIEKKLDLNEYMIGNQNATFFVKVQGDSMSGIGILHGDLIVVDRSIKPVDGKVVVAVVDGELTVKRLRQIKGKTYLVPENPDYEPIEIKEFTDFQIWGCVDGSLRKGCY